MPHKQQYPCTWPGCNHLSLTKSHLKRHENDKHTRERTFQCPEPGCGYAATQRSNLAPHLRTHNRNESPAPPACVAECHGQDPSRYHPYDSHLDYDRIHTAGTSTPRDLPALLSAQAKLLSQYSSLIPTTRSNNTFHQVPVEPTFCTHPGQEIMNITPAAIPLPFNHPYHPMNASDRTMGQSTGYTMIGGSERLPSLPSTGPDDPWNAASLLSTPRMETPQGREDIPYRPWVEYLGVVPSCTMSYGIPPSTVTRRRY